MDPDWEGLEMKSTCAPITGSRPGSFAHHVLSERHPAIIQQVIDIHPCSPQQLRRLHALATEISKDQIGHLDEDVHDYAAWEESGAAYYGRSWLDASFLWAESYFYRRLLQSLGFFDAGPSFWVDPFEYLKRTELDTRSMASRLDELRQLEDLPDPDTFALLMQNSLWGNRADLGFRIGVAATEGTVARGADTLTDDTPIIRRFLYDREIPARIALVLDNAGAEVVADLLLADALLHMGIAYEISLHLKPHPYYVSDAVGQDVIAALQRLAVSGGWARAAADRVRGAIREGSVRIFSHPFYCMPVCFYDMPDDLETEFRSTDLVLAKGDLNYRRLVGDCERDPTTDLSKVLNYFPCAVATLRVLKSDVIVGLDAGTVAGLEATRGSWRTDGTCAVVQALI